MKLLDSYRATIAAIPRRWPNEPHMAPSELYDVHTNIFCLLARKHGWDAVLRHSQWIDAILRDAEGRQRLRQYRQTGGLGWLERYRRKEAKCPTG